LFLGQRFARRSAQPARKGADQIAAARKGVGSDQLLALLGRGRFALIRLVFMHAERALT
jgi:hypothetical protein